MSICTSISFFIVVMFLYIPLIKSTTNDFKRNVQVTHNPDCQKFDCTGKGVNIFYARASSSDDVLHYLYTAGYAMTTPSVIIIRSRDLNAFASINYKNLFNNNPEILEFNGTVDGAFGLVFTKLYEYNDNDDKAQMLGNDWTTRTFDQFNWTGSFLNGDSKSISFKTSPQPLNNDTLLSNGNIEIKFNISDKQAHGSYLPRLLFTGNNTQIDFILDNLNTKYKNSRFGVEVALINKLNIQGMNVENVKSLDDEYSPGVFQIRNFFGQAQKSQSWQNSTYLQWKPVCYLSGSDRSLNNISVTYNTEPLSLSSNSSQSAIENSLAYNFFGSWIFQTNSSMKLMNVTFGMSGDKFYNNTKYVIWTSSFGQGTPAVDSISTTVIMVIAFGLGLPFILVVIGSIYLVIKKTLNKRRQYDTIEDPIN